MEADPEECLGAAQVDGAETCVSADVDMTCVTWTWGLRFRRSTVKLLKPSETHIP